MYVSGKLRNNEVKRTTKADMRKIEFPSRQERLKAVFGDLLHRECLIALDSQQRESWFLYPTVDSLNGIFWEGLKYISAKLCAPVILTDS